MEMIHNKVSKYFDLKYFAIFLSIYGFFYYFNMAYVGLVSVGGKTYSPFLDHYLNYVNWITAAILYTTNMITNLIGIKTVVFLPGQLKMMNGTAVNIAFPCIGLMNMSFWIAFIISQTTTIKQKAIWCVIGVIAIFIINCCRITVLSVALSKNSNINQFGEHHTVFNNIAYLLIGLLVYVYYVTNKKVNRDLTHNKVKS